MDIVQATHDLFRRFPSPEQENLLYILAGKDPYDWNTDYQIYAFGIGQGGGKNTYLIAPYSAYITYKIANMRDPWAYFSRFFKNPISKSTQFDITNSSMVNERQANQVHFQKMVDILRNATIPNTEMNWFEKYTGMNITQTVGDIRKKEIEIPLRAGCGVLKMHSFDSTPKAVEGLSILLGMIDEPSRADTELKFLEAKSLVKVITGNLNTRFPRNVGKLIVFSYLNNSEFDLTYEMIKQAEEEIKKFGKSTIYATIKSTFEINPNADRNDPAIISAYRTDPSDAKARYECIKGPAKEGFYQPYPHKPRECFTEMISPIDYKWTVSKREVRDPQGKGIQIHNFTAIEITKLHGDLRPRCWAFDAAEKYDGFVLKGGYVETMDEMKESLFIDGKTELIVVNKRPIIDIVLIWQPQEGAPVDFINVGEVMGQLLDNFPNSISAKSDKWNSTIFSQEMMRRGVNSETTNFGNQEQLRIYTKLRWLFFNNIPKFFDDKNHILRRQGFEKSVGDWNIEEHEHLLRINNNKIDHPKHGSKDFCDVDALLATELIELESSYLSHGTGIDTLGDNKIQALISRFIEERQKLRNAGIPEAQYLQRITDALQMTELDAKKLIEYAAELYPHLV